MRTRRAPVEDGVFELLRSHPTGQISYDSMAAELDRDRRVVIWAVARLRRRGQVQLVASGRGRRPNCYQLAQ